MILRIPKRFLFFISTLLICTGGYSAEDEGITFGNFHFSPSIEFQSLIESNVRHSTGNEEADTGFGIKPSAVLLLDNYNTYFNFSGYYYLLKYSGLFGYDHSDIDIYDNGGTNMTLKINKKGKFIPEISDNFYNLAYPREEFSQIEKNLLYRLHNDAFVKISYSPGDTIELNIKGSLNFDRYSTPVMNINRITSPVFNLQPKWRFLPKTAILIDAYIGYYDKRFYEEAAVYYGDPESGLGTGFTTLPNAQFFKTMLGITGQVSSKIQVQLMAGYGEADYEEVINQITNEPLDEDVRNEDGIIGLFQLKWVPKTTYIFTLKGRRDFIDSYFTNFYVGNSISGKFEGLFLNRFKLTGEMTGSMIDYRGAVMRSDVVLNTSITLSYQAKKWLSADAKYIFDYLDSTLTEVNYVDNRIYLALDLKY